MTRGAFHAKYGDYEIMAEAAKIEDTADKAAAVADKVEAKALDSKAGAAPVVAPVAAPAVAKSDAPAPVAVKPAVKSVAKAKSPVAKKVAAKPAAEAPAKRKYVRKAPLAAKSVAAKAKRVAVKPVAKAKPVKIATAPTTFISKLKETKMATATQKTADDFTAKIQDTVKDVQARAKTAFEKSQAMFGDAGEFTKGNLEAMVESSKILATGVQAMGKTYVAEVKSSLETVQADVKELTTVKSPADFVKMQSTLMRKYFDNVVAYNSKNAEAALKLANEAFQPISSRVSLAVEKVKKAA